MTADPEQLSRARDCIPLAKSASELLRDARLGVSASTHAKILETLETMPETCRRTYLKAMKGKSLTAATKAFCLDCVGWHRPAVRDCSNVACALHPYRAFKERKE